MIFTGLIALIVGLGVAAARHRAPAECSCWSCRDTSAATLDDEVE